MIQSKMKELNDKLGLGIQNLNLLSRAMDATPIHHGGDGKNHKEYANDSLATFGDAVLKMILDE